MAIPASTTGGAHHGAASLSHAERQAALNALARIRATPGRLVPALGAVKQSATLAGGAHKPDLGTSAPGHDTFIGGARSAWVTGAGNDTVVSGSTKPLGHEASHTFGPSGHLGLSSDTINIAGTTAASIKSTPQEETAKDHTVSLGDKTTVTISGLSTHDITKIHH